MWKCEDIGVFGKKEYIFHGNCFLENIFQKNKWVSYLFSCVTILKALIYNIDKYDDRWDGGRGVRCCRWGLRGCS